MKKDSIYSLPLEKVGDFRFDQQVVQVFGDMINRSVPGYSSILSMIGEIAERHAQPDTNLYDLGCSLGACTLMMHQRVPNSCCLHAVDSSEAMLKELKKKLTGVGDGCQIETHLADIRGLSFENASMTVLNFTLQFLKPPERKPLLQRIADSTNPGGALVLSEKICFPDPHEQELMTELHHSFKRANGYSDLEIAQKRTALENTLIPETLEHHLERLKTVGFSKAVCWFQSFNFVSVLAVK